MGETWRVDVARHRLDHRVVQRVEHHERGDQRLRVGRIEPERRERNVEGPSQLTLRPRRAGDRGSARNKARRGRGQEVAAGQGETIASRLRRLTIRLTMVMKATHNVSVRNSPLAGLAVNLDEPRLSVSPNCGGLAIEE